MSNQSRTLRRAAERKAAKLARKAERLNPAPLPEPTLPHKASPSANSAAVAALPPSASSRLSSAQLAANQANAQLSRGPVTPEGKAAVSQNRTTHGLNYNPATFRVLPCENQADYDHLLASLLEDEAPYNTVEQLLVIGMAQHRWLADRAHRLQETCLDPETGKILDPKLFALYLRYATTHERAFHKCLNDLVKIRIDKVKHETGFESQKGKQEAQDAKTRLTNAKAKYTEIENDIRHTLNTPLPGNTRIPFEDLTAALRVTFRDLNTNLEAKLAQKAAA